jgi:hypothetical protein
MMDFLDPKQRRSHNIRLIIGYVLLAIALGLALRILIYQANGLSVKDGKVVQNGFVFVSSSPSSAKINLTGQANGQTYNDTTNTRITAQSGTYTLRLSRTGYRDWQRSLTVQGDSIEHIDYPLLVPQTLNTAKLTDYNAPPPLSTQSPDRRWILNQQPGVSGAAFDVYDLKDNKKVSSLKTSITVPTSLFGINQDGAQSLELVEWSNDNDHVLLRHVVGDQSEYVLVSHKAPETSINLTKQLQLTATATLTLQDKKFDHYFVLDPASSGALSTIALDGTKATPAVPVLTDVIAFKSYGTDTILYATNTGASADKVAVRMLQDGKSYTIRQVAKSPTYLLELSRYSNHWYAAVGVASENHVYEYKDPVEALQADPSQSLMPVDVMKVTAPNYVAFSDSSQYVAVENGQDFSVYDAENDRSHTYHVNKPLDAPQVHATWMDGYHLRMVSGGTVTMFDFDGTNIQSLEPALPGYLPFFDTGYQTSYAIDAPKGSTGTSAIQAEFGATPLRTPEDR